MLLERLMSSLMLGHKDVFLWTVHDQLRSSTTKKPYQGSDQDSRSSDHPTPSVPIIAHIPLQIASLLFADEVVLTTVCVVSALSGSVCRV